MWLLRRVLRDTAEKERHRRVEAERLIQFMSHEGLCSVFNKFNTNLVVLTALSFLISHLAVHSA